VLLFDFDLFYDTATVVHCKFLSVKHGAN